MKTSIRISEARYVSLSENYGGFCLTCGAEAYGVEPDARNYTCDVCGEPQVYGVEELLVMGQIEFTKRRGGDN